MSDVGTFVLIQRIVVRLPVGGELLIARSDQRLKPRRCNVLVLDTIECEILHCQLCLGRVESSFVLVVVMLFDDDHCCLSYATLAWG